MGGEISFPAPTKGGGTKDTTKYDKSRKAFSYTARQASTKPSTILSPNSFQNPPNPSKPPKCPSAVFAFLEEEKRQENGRNGHGYRKARHYLVSVSCRPASSGCMACRARRKPCREDILREMRNRAPKCPLQAPSGPQARANSGSSPPGQPACHDKLLPCLCGDCSLRAGNLAHKLECYRPCGGRYDHGLSCRTFCERQPRLPSGLQKGICQALPASIFWPMA